MKKHFLAGLSLFLLAGVVLTGCGKDESSSSVTESSSVAESSSAPAESSSADVAAPLFTVAMVTDVGGVDDKSFNQSAWEGLQKYGADNKLEKGEKGFDYLQSKGDADYSTNLNKLVRSKFNLVIGIGFLMHDAVQAIATQQPDAHFAIVDSVVEVKEDPTKLMPNVANITFKEHEGSFLVGVVAGLTTKTNKIGFVGGINIPLIVKFEKGFLAGVKSVNPKAEITVQYTGAFDKADLGKTTASSMYASGVDVIYHAAGGTGTGVFSEAKDLKAKDPAREIWVIGVDKDQSPEGVVKAGDKEVNITLTSMVKRVDVGVYDVTMKSRDGKFPGGQVLEYGLVDGGVDIAPTQENIKPEVLTAVAQWKDKLINGEVKAPSTQEEYDTFLTTLK